MGRQLIALVSTKGKTTQEVIKELWKNYQHYLKTGQPIITLEPRADGTKISKERTGDKDDGLGGKWKNGKSEGCRLRRKSK